MIAKALLEIRVALQVHAARRAALRRPFDHQTS
jgi:hypothetical protein